MTTPVLAAENVRVRIGKVLCCEGLDFVLNEGEMLAILGANGTGKSTLMSTLSGVRTPDRGELCLFGKPYAALSMKDMAKQRGYLPQKISDPFAATVKDTALMGRHPHLSRFAWESTADETIVKDALCQMGLSGFEDRDIRTLSGGERKRLAIATLLAQSPKLYLLDEPLAHLDLKHQIAVLSRFAQKAHAEGIAVILVLHEPALAYRFASHVLFLYGEGKSEFGQKEAMLTSEKLSRLYGYPVAIENGQMTIF